MLSFVSLKWFAILVGLVAHMILGAAWFGIFATPWARLAHPGKSKEQIQAGPKWIYGIAAGGGLLTAIVMAALFESLHVVSIVEALTVTGILWAAFVFAKYATTYAFAWKPWPLLWLDVGYPLVSMVAMGIIYAAWP